MASSVQSKRLARVWPLLLQELARSRRVPVATYRLQCHADFPFTHVQRMVPYLHALGITDCYISPYLRARPGSTHGYDIIDPQVLNPEIGTPEAYDALVCTLQQYSMGLLMDIVPNHLAVIGAENAWWHDVLTHGPASVYARFFDIDWEPPHTPLRHKILLPILGAPYGEVLAKQELCLLYDRGVFALQYYEHRLPIDFGTVHELLTTCLALLDQEQGGEQQYALELQRIITTIEHLPACTEQRQERVTERYRAIAASTQRLAALHDACPVFRTALETVLRTYNGTPDEPCSFDQLHALLEAQAYRLSYWRTTTEALNYRRFFDLAHLAGVRVEEPAVFEATHALILQMLEAGDVTGVRVDHPDGLYDPTAYCAQLQQAYVQSCCRRVLVQHGDSTTDIDADTAALTAQFVTTYTPHPRLTAARPLYVVVEKILEAHEALPATWTVDGTTGYEVLNQLNGLFVDRRNAEAFAALYTAFTGDDTPWTAILYSAKMLLMQTTFVSELAALGQQLVQIAATDRGWRDYSRQAVTQALQEVIACFPVYRTYVGMHERSLSAADRAVIDTALTQAQQRTGTIPQEIFGMLHDVLTLRHPVPYDESEVQRRHRFVMRMQQVTGPVMAKSLEDTAFYRYTPLASLNEVGGDPNAFGLSVEAFHQCNIDRLHHWPTSLVATSTHDTKRSEDVRARLNVLSEIPARWRACIVRWHTMNRQHRAHIDGRVVPSPQEEYFLYQTLLGVWPFSIRSQAARDGLLQRVQDYMRKALREAKVHTTWVDPQPAYEDAVARFVQAILDDRRGQAFLEDFGRMQAWIADYGIWNALSQTLLKITLPGVPDIYQGCELWDFSLVDPDNRRPVDYAQRQSLLDSMRRRVEEAGSDRLALVHELLHSRQDGRVKLYLTWQALTFRRAHADLFQQGVYVPLQVCGSASEHLCAFARVHGAAIVLVLTPRLLTHIMPDNYDIPLGEAVWADTHVVLPETWGNVSFRHLLTAETIHTRRVGTQSTLPVAVAFRSFPVAMLATQGERSKTSPLT